MRDRSFVVQMLMLAVGLALMWTWAVQALETGGQQRRVAAALERARRDAALQEIRSTAPPRETPRVLRTAHSLPAAPARTRAKARTNAVRENTGQAASVNAGHGEGTVLVADRGNSGGF
jgi:hypothetical protein